VIAGHNELGFEMEELLSHRVDLNVSTWSKVGQRRKMQLLRFLHSVVGFQQGQEYNLCVTTVDSAKFQNVMMMDQVDNLENVLSRMRMCRPG
jgi:hypothetical protein